MEQTEAVSQAPPIDTGIRHPMLSEKLVVVMVGLPARGKTYIATKLAYYLNWISLSCKVFNLGRYRREKFGPSSPAQFFHPNNVEGIEQRKKLALDAVEDLDNYLKSGGVCAVFDATNSTRERRSMVIDEIKKRGLSCLIVESVCDDDDRIDQNIMQVKVGLPDYQETTVKEAVSDFKERIEYYKVRYEPLSTEVDGDLSFIKLVDVGRYFIIHRIEGYLQMRISRFLMNIHVYPRHIYISRHGESVFNTKGFIGGDSDLSPRGQMYAKKLRSFMKKEGLSNLKVWCSTLKRTIQTANQFKNAEAWKALDELDAGECDGLTYEQIEAQHPDMYQKRVENKYYTRYPRGESYADVVQRLEPRIMELERTRQNVLVVCHQAVARCFLAYFQSMSDLESELPYLQVPLHTVFKITPIPYGNRIEIFNLGVDAVDTHRPREGADTGHAHAAHAHAVEGAPDGSSHGGIFVPGPPEVAREELIVHAAADGNTAEPKAAKRGTLADRRAADITPLNVKSRQESSESMDRSIPCSPQPHPSKVIIVSPQEAFRSIIHTTEGMETAEDVSKDTK